ncbi:MAG TPA: aminoacyl-tRNA hydrolase [Candidatus Paceibacterota bacterium]
MYTIIGLGNPGAEYVGTRHNTGKMIARRLAESLDIGKKVRFIESEQFMNNSGPAVAKAMAGKKAFDKLIVIHDDLDLPLGTYKLSFNKGPGGHRGVGSIIKALKTEGFLRFRVGISPTTPSGKLRKPLGEDKVLKFILGQFKKEDISMLKKLSKRIGASILILVERGREVAMSQAK